MLPGLGVGAFAARDFLNDYGNGYSNEGPSSQPFSRALGDPNEGLVNKGKALV